MNFKGEMTMLNVLHLEDPDVNKVTVALQKKRDEMPQFFNQSPVVIDCNLLDESLLAEYDFVALKATLLGLGFIPVGIRNIPASLKGTLMDAGWALMRESRKTTTSNVAKKPVTKNAPTAKSNHGSDTNNGSDKNEADEKITQAPAKSETVIISKPVRSGQQIYAPHSDMTVLAKTSAGSEIMADGSIHVYGALRGRVLAGATGNESARIYCQSLQAELIAIAGRYQLLDESETNLIGKPAMIKLVDEKIVIEPL